MIKLSLLTLFPIPLRATHNEHSTVQLPDGSLFFLNARVDVDAGLYYCVASNEYGSVRSRNATLEIACECSPPAPRLSHDTGIG